MLKGISPILSPELLSTLRAMGHGDEIAPLVDETIRAGARAPAHRLDGQPACPVLDAGLSILRSTIRAERSFGQRSNRTANALDPVHRDIIVLLSET